VRDRERAQAFADGGGERELRNERECKQDAWNHAPHIVSTVVGYWWLVAGRWWLGRGFGPRWRRFMLVSNAQKNWGRHGVTPEEAEEIFFHER
jgi:hypothetical protein